MGITSQRITLGFCTNTVIGSSSLVQGDEVHAPWCMLTSQGVREGDLVGFQILRSSCQSLKMQGFLAVCTSSFVRRFSFRMNLYDTVVWITPLHHSHCSNYWTGRTFHSDHLSLVDQVDAGYRQLIHGALAMCIRGANHPASPVVVFEKKKPGMRSGLPYLIWLAVLQPQEISL